MKEQVISYTKKDESGEEQGYSVTMQVPEDIHEMINVWGENVAYHKAMAQIIIDARRRCYDADTVEAAQEAVNNWTPGVITRTTGGVSKKALMELLGELDKDALAELVARLKAQKN